MTFKQICSIHLDPWLFPCTEEGATWGSVKVMKSKQRRWGAERRQTTCAGCCCSKRQFDLWSRGNVLAHKCQNIQEVSQLQGSSLEVRLVWGARAVGRHRDFVPTPRKRKSAIYFKCNLFLQWYRLLFGYMLDNTKCFRELELHLLLWLAVPNDFAKKLWNISEVLQTLKMSLWYSEEAAKNFSLWSPGVSGQGDKVPNAQGPQLWGGGA